MATFSNLEIVRFDERAGTLDSRAFALEILLQEQRITLVTPVAQCRRVHQNETK